MYLLESSFDCLIAWFFLATSQREVVIFELKNPLDSLVIYIHKEVNLEQLSLRW
jgi:hypothetical protein